MATETTPRSGLPAPVSTGTSQAVLSTTAPSARDLRKYMTLSRVRFGSPTGVARVWRAVARGFASPAFAGFAFIALPLEEGGALPNSVCRLLLRERNGRQQLDDFSSRWRPGGLSDSRRRSPVALRHRLSTALL